MTILGGDLWSEDYPGVSKWMEAQTDKLDYDLRGWEPVEYEYLKVYPAINSESKISEVALVSSLDGQVNMTCPVGKLVGPMGGPADSTALWPKYQPARPGRVL
ncbi:hypothetical protein PPACK8108_LOCUS4366 [Phakopsora pachyrhizi]|uniref:Uncharacterized protein n=1 Tax=Phakopsora pachyrhizi TaxID=170000 RepID=A0AAV0ALS1_PHAPC|nr:hypothetical protein PPACK8108_LOCUS4366 [Phakopsora pachyrhizi]